MSIDGGKGLGVRLWAVAIAVLMLGSALGGYQYAEATLPTQDGTWGQWLREAYGYFTNMLTLPYLTDGRLLTVDSAGNVTSTGIDVGTGDDLTGVDNLSTTDLTVSGLTAGRVPIVGVGGLIGSDADLTFSVDTLTATKIGATTLTGAISGNGQDITGVDDLEVNGDWFWGATNITQGIQYPQQGRGRYTIFKVGALTIAKDNNAWFGYTISTNSSVSLNAAIAACKAAGGGQISIGPGTYTLYRSGTSPETRIINLPTKVSLIGEGEGVTILTQAAGQNANIFLQSENKGNAPYSLIQDLTIDVNYTNQVYAGFGNANAGTGITNYGNYWTINRVTVKNAGIYGGVWMQGKYNDVHDLTVDTTYSHNAAYTKWSVAIGNSYPGTAYNTWTNIRGLNIAGAGVYFEDKAQNNTVDGLYINTTGYSAVLFEFGTKYNLVTHATIVNSAAEGVKFWSNTTTGAWACSGNSLTETKIFNSATMGVSLIRAQNTTLSLVEAWNSGGDGFNFDTATNVNAVQLLAIQSGGDGFNLTNSDEGLYLGSMARNNALNGWTLSSSDYLTFTGGGALKNGYNGYTATGGIRNTIQGGDWSNNGQAASATYYNIKYSGDEYLIQGNIMANDLTNKCKYNVYEIGGDNSRIIANFARGSTNDPSIKTVGSGTQVRFNRGFATESSGTATILNAATSIVINHGLAYTPTTANTAWSITPLELSTNDPGQFYIDTFTATQATIHSRNDPGASNLDLQWSAHMTP